MKQNAQNTLSMADERARRRREVAERRERLVSIIDRVCDQAALGEDQIQAALSIASHRRSVREARCDGERRRQSNVKVL